MSQEHEKEDLLHYLQQGREALLWKLDGLGEYDVRRPLTPTGTNLLGVVKHVASVEAGYLGDCFGQPFPQAFPWFADDAEPNADMWATPDESVASIVDLYHRVWAHSDGTVAELDLDTKGTVSWWSPERRHPTLHRTLVHVIAETHRHAGHMDIVRELVDGAAGLRVGASNLPSTDEAFWAAHHARVDAAAREAAGVS